METYTVMLTHTNGATFVEEGVVAVWFCGGVLTCLLAANNAYSRSENVKSFDVYEGD